MDTVSLRSRLAFFLALVTLGTIATAEDKPPMPASDTRPPLPSPSAIKEFPPDGGPGFNRLVFESSPYLLQHAANPVDWYPWGEAAFERARTENKPVFLSVGYSTCHWCHVMERESFEDDEVAALMNEHFVCVKVDREERPDIDKIYMDVTQAMTGSGGWPMTVIMTPEGKPFFAGTYYPKHSVPGRPGMMQIAEEIGRVWQEERGQIDGHAEKVAAMLSAMHGPGSEADALSEETLHAAYRQFMARYDEHHGGFGSAPKFPTPHNFTFLLRYGARTGEPQAADMVEKTLTAMRLGGIWDHVGFGFHRYSTDERWLLPHFEKMLYDQALIALACLETWQVTGNPLMAETAREIFTYVRRDMTSPEGGFYSAEDADSEGEEGKFYVWSVEEVRDALGDEAERYIELFNLEKKGNFRHETGGGPTGDNIPHLTAPLYEAAKSRGGSVEELETQVETLRRRLFEVREERVHPLKDDKILTDWNGLMIAAFARGARVLKDPELAAAAKGAADFALARLRDDRGRLYKRYRKGSAGLTGLLDDYAFLTWGLIELYESTGETRFLEEAGRLTDLMLKHFTRPARGGMYLSPDDGAPLLVRPVEVYDGAIPSGNSVAAGNLLRLAHMTGSTRYAEAAAGILGSFADKVGAIPSGHTQFLGALDFSLGPVAEVVLVGEAGSPGMEEMREALRRAYLPRTVTLLKWRRAEDAALASLAPFTEGMKPGPAASAYVCRDFTCAQPTTEPTEMLGILRGE